MAPTLREVAERAGVSRSAVSRCFTEGASVSKRMRSKVEKAALELGYSPNMLARSLTTGSTKLIGLVSSNFKNPYFLEVFDLFTRGLQDRGLRPLLVNLSNETDPAHSVQMLRQYSVDGVIVASSTLSPDFAKAFRAAAIPVVHTFGRKSGSPEVHVVGIDNEYCGQMAATEFLARGYTNIGFLGGPETASSTKDRWHGFSSELARYPEIIVTASFANAYTFPAGRMAMIQLLDGTPAQAYFCADDAISIGAVSAIREAGLRVPEDIGVLGLNDMEMAGWELINLTTIHQPVEDIVKSSIELMVSLLETPSRRPEARTFACHVVERGTLRPRIHGLT